MVYGFVREMLCVPVVSTVIGPELVTSPSVQPVTSVPSSVTDTTVP